MTTQEKFPPLFYVRLRAFKWRITKWLLFVWLVTLDLTANYFVGPRSWGEFSPLLWAIALYVSLSCFAAWGDLKRSRVIVYFPKQKVRVQQTTLLTGRALACEWQNIEQAASEVGAEPLSTFGLEDENEVRDFEWHDAARGLATVEALLATSQLSDEVRADLVCLEAALREASEKEVPFRLLLREDGGVSPMQMDIRKGYF